MVGTMKQTICDQHVTRQFLELPAHGKVQAEYIWLGGSIWDIRSKTKTLSEKPKSPDDLPLWNYDGSSTGQAPGDDSEVYLKPRAIYPDPFRRGDNILVMCDAYIPLKPGQEGDMKPIPTNTRLACAEVMDKAAKHVPWFGIEQEYTLKDAQTGWPLGWPTNGFPGAQGPYYCGVGTGKAIARDVVEAHYKACLYANINLSGINAEVMPSQWEYQVGPCTGIDSADQLWISRYIMLRVCEMYDVICDFDPKPIPGDWNGAGCHTNYSTVETRTAPGGFDAIQKQIEKLAIKHKLTSCLSLLFQEHILVYGEGNERRLTGKHETASIDKFGWGVADRGKSIRVGRAVPLDDCGYYEDRRPASNMDPYEVTRMIVQTTLLDD
eukprot:jgi/Chlat1/8317/Chrsp78S09215